MRTKSSYIVISIRDPGRRPARIPRPTLLRNAIYLSFDDAEPPLPMSGKRQVKLMRAADADLIAEFVRIHRHDVGLIVCQCEQGASRSPAIAAALAAGWGDDTGTSLRFIQPNRYVYDLVCTAVRRSRNVADTS